jgi:hypothetical protein
MFNHKYFPTIVAGFGAGVLTTVPVIKTLSCCIIIPAAVILALYADKKITKLSPPTEFSYFVVFGLFVGLFSAFFGSSLDVLMTLITKQNDFVASYPDVIKMFSKMPFLPGSEESMKEALQILSTTRDEIVESGFSGFYTFLIFLNNLILYPIFGMLGGLLGKAIIEKA